MKKLMVLAAALAISGSAYAIDPEAGLIDRLDGTYTFECSGTRTDNGVAADWNLTKQNMDYLTYGIASHVVIDALNKMYAGIGDKAIKSSVSNLPDGLPVPGVTR